METKKTEKIMEASRNTGRVLVKGSGDLASGIALRLYRAGFQILMTEIAVPTTVRRTVAFSPAVYLGRMQVEDVTGVLCDSVDMAEKEIGNGNIAVMVDEHADCIREFQPDVLVDAILAKRNLGTRRDMAPLTIALGPGFTAGEDVDVVVETKRGHRLGRIIREGAAIPNTGIPGVIGGYGAERVIHAQAAGIFKNVRVIGDSVEAGDTIAEIWQEDGTKLLVQTQITGILRGLLRDGYLVTEHFKVADVDPRKEELSNCFLISDKARCIAGSVLELVCAQLWK